MIRNLERQRLHTDLALHLREHAALFHADGLADEIDRDGRLDRLVEPHLVQVDVREASARNFLLVVLEHGRMRRLLTGEDDVEDRVQAGVAGQRAPELALGHAERMGRLAAPVEDAWDEPLVAQAPRVRRTAALALGDFQLHAFAGHLGGEV